MSLGKWLKSVFGGATSGAAAGSAAGPWGALAGLGAGALLSGGSSALHKSPRQQNISRLSPQQLGWQNEAGQAASAGLKNPYAGFEPIEQNARQQFQQSTIPSLAERFTAMGSGGQNSSAFQSALGQAGAGLESNLAAQRSEYGLRNKQLSGGLLNQALQPNFDTRFAPQQPGFLESTFGALAEPLGQYGAQGLLGTGYESEEGLPQDFQGLAKNPKFLSFLRNPKTQQFLKAQGIM